jgi:hypothetical protein
MQWRRQLGWRPRDATWRVPVLFMVGSVLFAVGSFPFYAQLVDPGAVGATFAAGSVFFTLAAAGQFHQTARVEQLAWWAALVQLVGTLLFNLSTFDAMLDGLTIEETNRLVWAPDVFGSIAFLVASHLGWRFVRSRSATATASDASERWSAVANYVGSVLFMLSAIAAFTLETTGEVVNTAIVNSTTCAGALCFLAGAYVLLPPSSA